MRVRTSYLSFEILSTATTMTACCSPVPLPIEKLCVTDRSAPAAPPPSCGSLLIAKVELLAPRVSLILEIDKRSTRSRQNLNAQAYAHHVNSLTHNHTRAHSRADSTKESCSSKIPKIKHFTGKPVSACPPILTWKRPEANKEIVRRRR